MNAKRELILLVDGNWLAARSAFALPTTIKLPSGRGANAILGFFMSFLRLTRLTAPTRIGVAFDSLEPTFRHKIAENYKAGRPDLPADFQAQLQSIKDLLVMLGVTNHTAPGYEADDILASWSAKAFAENTHCAVTTGDKDLFQVVRDPFVRVLRPTSRTLDAVQQVDEQWIKDNLHVTSDQYLLFSAICGDRSDNLPGVPGLGPKRTAKLLSRYATLDSLLNATEPFSSRWLSPVQENGHLIHHNLRVMALRTNLPVPWPISNLSEFTEKRADWGPSFVASGLERFIDEFSTLSDVAHSRPSQLDAKKNPQRIALVSCSAKKSSTATRAEDLYTSPLFEKSKEWAMQHCDQWFILSALHGLVAPSECLEPYDSSLRSREKSQVEAWADGVTKRLEPQVRTGDVVVFLAGNTYSQPLLSRVEDWPIYTHLPLSGLPLGVRLRWLNEEKLRPDLSVELKYFYSLLSTLMSGLGESIPRLQDCHGRMDWPRRGIYFFFNDSEPRASGFGVRVVRVGTHAVGVGAKSTLWSRLRTHKGHRSGNGSHRSSVFRLHVGAALLASSSSSESCPTWGKSSPTNLKHQSEEVAVERRVSTEIGRMRVLVLPVPDDPSPDSDRAFLERNAIALLSTAGARLDPPTSTWLGLSSPEATIRRTGLWNLQHSEAAYDHRFLDVLRIYVEYALGNEDKPTERIAPNGWRQSNTSAHRKQLPLTFDEE